MADDYAFRETGITFRASEARGRMPRKQRGKHRWITVASYFTTNETLKAAKRGEPTFLDMENLLDVAAGCFDCEQTWPAPEPCPADDQWGDDREG